MVDKLYKLEEEIENYYIILAQLEINGGKDSLEYNEYYQLIINSTKKETEFFNSNWDNLGYLQKSLKKDYKRKLSNPLMLGFINNAFYERLYNMLEYSSGDDCLAYVQTLEYDKNQIILAFLDNLISNPYYEDIRSTLIYYKYNLIFMNIKTEYDFLIGQESSTIDIETPSYRTNDFLVSKYLDKAVLVLPTSNNITDIFGVPENFKEDNSTYALLVIKLMNILASLSLCEEDTLSLLEEEIIDFENNDIIPLSVKEVYHELLEILRTLKNKIIRTR